MILLSVDSAGKTAAAAVSNDGKILSACFADEGLTHSQMLLPLVDRALKEAGIPIGQVDCFAVTNGPGSFTGLRIGCALVKGMAMGRPCIPVPTLRALAFNEAHAGRTAVAVLDARCNQVYLGAYAFSDGKAVSRIADQACSLEQAAKQIRALPEPLVLLGDGASLLQQLADGERIRMGTHHAILGESVASAAEDLIPKAPEALAPTYFRLSQAEREYQLKQKQKEKTMVVLGADKAGAEWLPQISRKLEEMGIENKIIHPGTEEGSDYTDAAFQVAALVAGGQAEKGVLVCGTGIGMSIAANKVKGIRASVCSDCYSARMTVVHNDSNILCMGARVLGIELALMIVEEYFSAVFESGGRHERRVNAIRTRENS